MAEWHDQGPMLGIGDDATVRAAFDALPMLVAVLEGPQCRIVAANAGYREFVGRSHLLGRPLREAFPEVEGQRFFELIDQVYATDRARSLHEWRLQFDATGTGRLDEHYVNVDVRPRRNSGGTVSGIYAFLTDATAQVRERIDAQRRAVRAEKRYQQARDVVADLQRHLLPAAMPVLPGLDVAASYLVANSEDSAGGDWFDAVPLRDGRIALVVGDVVGHGVAASSVMVQLRSVLRDRLATTADIGRSLAAVDRFAGDVPGATAATVCVATLDPGDGALEYCTAGHPPPLVLPAGADGRYLPATGAGPLATGSAFPTACAELAEGDQVLLYSDGVIERPGVVPTAGTVELSQVAAPVAAGIGYRVEEGTDAERLATVPVELLVRDTGHVDDITLLAAGRTAVAAPLDVSTTATPRALAPLRTALRDWLADVRAGADDVIALVHAVGELVTNATRHAYLDTAPGPLALHGEHRGDGRVRISVGDRGRWRESATKRADADGGLGLMLAGRLVDELTVDRADTGTTVTAVHRLSRPTRLLDIDLLGAPATPARGPGDELLLILDQPDGKAPRIRVDGPIDARTAAQLATELGDRTRGGTRPLTVDLTGVELLASAGVSILHRAMTRSERGGGALTLYAPADGVAGHVLALVTLPHTVTDPDGSR